MLAPSLLLAAALASDPAPARPPACATPAHRAFDFWEGSWEVTAGGQLAGTNRIERILGGCALQEHWTGAKGLRGTSLNWFDASGGAWRQLWIASDGSTLSLAGGLRGAEMVLEGVAPGPDGKPQAQRITWTPLGGGKVRQRWEASGDGGKTWKLVFDGLYARKA